VLSTLSATGSVYVAATGSAVVAPVGSRINPPVQEKAEEPVLVQNSPALLRTIFWGLHCEFARVVADPPEREVRLSDPWEAFALAS